MDYPDLRVSKFMEDSIGPQRVKRYGNICVIVLLQVTSKNSASILSRRKDKYFCNEREHADIECQVDGKLQKEDKSTWLK